MTLIHQLFELEAPLQTSLIPTYSFLYEITESQRNYLIKCSWSIDGLMGRWEWVLRQNFRFLVKCSLCFQQSFPRWQNRVKSYLYCYTSQKTNIGYLTSSIFSLLNFIKCSKIFWKPGKKTLHFITTLNKVS